MHPRQARQQRPKPRHYRNHISKLLSDKLRVGNSFLDLLCGVSRLKRAVGHAALPARRTVRRRGPAAQAGDGRRVLVDGAGGLLRGHAGGGAEGLLLVFVRGGGLGLLLRVRLLVLLRRLLVLLLLLLVLRLRRLVLRVVLRRSGILVHRRLLRGSCEVRGLRVLLRGDWKGQYGRVVRLVEGLGCAAQGYRLCDMLLGCCGF